MHTGLFYVMPPLPPQTFDGLVGHILLVVLIVVVVSMSALIVWVVGRGLWKDYWRK